MAKQLCFLDMDGVLSDFVGGISAAHNRPSPYTRPESWGVFEMEKLWGISEGEFWKLAEGFEFWSGLHPTEEATEIVKLVEEGFGRENIAILSAPSLDAGCIPGKREWMRKHFPQFTKSMIFTSAKHFLAGEDRYLVDDRDKNLINFAKAGGRVVVVPRLWNASYKYSQMCVEKIKQQLEMM